MKATLQLPIQQNIRIGGNLDAPKIVLLAGIIYTLLIMAGAIYGFAATNSLDSSNAGEGVGVLSGYDISNVHYTLDVSNPNEVAAIKFALAGAKEAKSVYIELDSYTGWITCTVSGSDATCDTSDASVPLDSAFTELRVVAAQ